MTFGVQADFMTSAKNSLNTAVEKTKYFFNETLPNAFRSGKAKAEEASSEAYEKGKEYAHEAKEYVEPYVDSAHATASRGYETVKEHAQSAASSAKVRTQAAAKAFNTISIKFPRNKF